MGSLGNFAFVLHTHLPYCRNAGIWPHGEEWLYQATAETYVPLLEMISDLAARARFCVTASLTPVLAEQLAARPVMQRAREYIEDRAARARADVDRFERQGDATLAALAAHYAGWYTNRLRAFQDHLGEDIIGSMARLQRDGVLEVITSAGTHPYLPLLSRDSSIYGQVRTGVEAYRRHFGRDPHGLWLPECAYRPAVVDGDGVTRPGIEAFLAHQGIRFTFVEAHAIEGGVPPTSTGHLVPWYTGANRLIGAMEPRPDAGYTTALPYFTGNSAVAAIGRNRTLSMQVWSAAGGYPGEADYREFHKRDSVSGMQYWSITGNGVDLGSKAPYRPEVAAARVRGHADHFAAVVIAELERLAGEGVRDPLVTAVFDTELFGHWWFEGIEWLGLVLERLAADKRVAIGPIGDYLAAHPPRGAIEVPESSWGAAGDHRTWLNPSTEAMWIAIHEAERQVERLVAEARPDRRRIVRQAVRELVLAQSSDWPFLVTTGQARAYAEERFRVHLERLSLLTSLATADQVSDQEERYLAQVEGNDSLFAFIEPGWFAARQGHAGQATTPETGKG